MCFCGPLFALSRPCFAQGMGWQPQRKPQMDLKSSSGGIFRVGRDKRIIRDGMLEWMGLDERGAGIRGQGQNPIRTWLHRLAGILFCFIFVLRVLTRGGPLETVIVISGNCRRIIIKFSTGENPPVLVRGVRSRSGVPERIGNVLPLPFTLAGPLGSYKGRSLLSLRPFDFPPSPRPYHCCSSSSQRDMELDFQIDTSWCMGCSRQILPKRSYTPVPQHLPPQPPTRMF